MPPHARALNTPDNRLTLARLRILDALAGPSPETPDADQQRARDRERIVAVEEPGVVITRVVPIASGSETKPPT